MPLYQLRIYAEYVGPLEAAAIDNAVIAATAPHMKNEDRRQLLRQLDAIQRPLNPEPERKRIEVIEHNPEKAREWFIQHGFEVVSHA